VANRQGGDRLLPQRHLRFELDRGAERSIEISSLLDEIRVEREAREAAQASEQAPEAEPEPVTLSEIAKAVKPTARAAAAEG